MADRELSLIEKQQLRDEMHRARLMAQHMDHFIAALSAPRTTREINQAAFDRAMATPASDPVECCQRCGRKGTPPCACSTPDRPPEYPNTGWAS